MFGLILTIIFLVIDIIISIWNSYNAGKIYAYRKGLGGVVYTLGGFLPISYVFVIIVTVIFAYLGYLSFSDVVFLLSFSFLFFGLAIVMWGVIATTFSFIATVKGKDWKAGLITVYNAFATIFDAYEYITGFLSAWKSVRRAIDSSDFSIIDVIAVIAIAVGIGFVISYVAFKEGLKSEQKVRYIF
ncbi:hypothetical protein [Sulfurisphaera ohwakuensis]|uniref:Uncharacterized protein n=1 Tax=Sulfurisphaera ohwakuensis TaxID=69656 RepID=A0A650CIE0_SULOH|nr:hypothetical protein [Sulfurisphaera ohwakuensis]MBB5253785.1 hypothetical protein [Sulfurisphaera ohwakuensis]QGR17539.1 hypothetical protein D1869_10320 [Sulfurisphaera ohwakuensis]